MPRGIYPRTEEARQNMSKSHLGHIPWNKGLKFGEHPSVARPWLGKKRPEIRMWLSGASGWKQTEEVKRRISETHSGPNHYRWNPNREEVRYDRRGDPLYKQWRKEVKKRDGFVCKMKNNDCGGRLEVHHILSWAHYPELRYDIKNGITLCHAHHPKTRAKEKEMEATLLSLITEC